MTAPTLALHPDGRPDPGRPLALVPETGVAAGTSGTTVGLLAQDPVTFSGLSAALGCRPSLLLTACRGATVPAVVVVAADTVDASVAGTVRALSARGSRVVLVVPDLDGPQVVAVVDAGVQVVLPRREAGSDRLADAVRAAACGEVSVPAEWLRRAAGPADPACGAPAAAPEPGEARTLTARELDVLRMLAEGASTADIAGALAYSESTVKTAIHGMTQRLRLRNRTHAVAYALRAGLI
jgi:DNA-binding NarL/FixJ family response regulator